MVSTIFREGAKIFVGLNLSKTKSTGVEVIDVLVFYHTFQYDPGNSALSAHTF